ncbi:hypothetical protein K1T71_001070 [Dendrolimus kikuchii]|uniref:Uncharacterized protein n=1 Tax=Dendrolimus kikuchii TaxID=765133 RepID=A0ACC1DGI1_9NEOP|nr:hypothetical protein K1T71_001070 [Dendrolimus kikuchii]
MHVISKICGDQPIAKLNTSNWSHINSLPLADPGFDVPDRIDLLLGAGVFAESLRDRPIKGNANQPIAVNSVFGWLLFGKTQLATHSLVNITSENNQELNSLVQRFWEIDSLPKVSLLTPDEKFCEQNFASTHTRDKFGRYIVHLPFKANLQPRFEGSRVVALRRFYAIERKLSRDSDLRQQYCDFMSDYINTDEGNSIHISFLCSKARVVPLKRLSLPRLELCAAVLLSDLFKFVKETYSTRISFDNVFLWSDSTITLTWLRSPSSRWATFVANRVSHIQELTPIECWYHISSENNPADICSRGQFPNELIHNSLWWAGPSWLSQCKECWPNSIDNQHQHPLRPWHSEIDNGPLTLNRKKNLIFGFNR